MKDDREAAEFSEGGLNHIGHSLRRIKSMALVWMLTVGMFYGCASAPSQESSPPSAVTVSRGAAAAPDGERSVLTGVFTSEQAARGEATFQQVCRSCHGDGREFAGMDFQRRWANRTVGDIFQRLSTTMPLDRPGRLTPQEYADIVAFFLRLNDYPVGAMKLPPELFLLQRVRFEGLLPIANGK
jgi:S-disulfanyl-L-cysteine oxidoreductase SoxD